MLSLMLFLPLIGAVAILFLFRQEKPVKYTALLFTALTFVLSLVFFASFDRTASALQFVERAVWVPAIKAQYFLGIDGLNLPLVLLTTLLGFLSVLISWNINTRVKEYFFWLLVLETGVLGVFLSLDLLLFFLFWEVELVPMYMLISTWGSAPPLGRREYSAMKFMIYTMLGSAFMLAGFLALYFSTGSFDMIELRNANLQSAIVPAVAIFWLIFVAYMVKLPVFPLHTWLPDAHTDAPTAVSVILAGVLLKMGGYAMIRIGVGIFPEVVREFSGLLVALAVVSVLYGAAVTLVQQDLKRLVAYSSVSHMGYVLLGVSAMNEVALTGATLQMFTHGTITGLLFALVGLLYDKAHTRRVADLGGLAKRMPVITVVFTVAGLASLGLPSMSGFVAEILVFLGSFPVWGVATIFAAFGVVLAAGYILWMLERAFFGPLNPRHQAVADATALETVPLFSLVFLIMLIGIYPSLLTDIIKLTIERAL